MKYYKSILVLSFSFLFGQRFDSSDPPMIYIYHFVSYDTTSVVLHGGEQDESQNKLLKLPFFNVGDVFTNNNTIISKPLNPKVVSSMVTSSIAKNRHVKIAGESIQNRLNRDDFLKIVKSYNYPKRTDFVFIGEINSIADQYEIDLKLIDVSLQEIVGSKSFNLPFNSITELRPLIDAVVEPLIEKMLSPFLGYAFLSVDSTSRSKVRWDNISIRPMETLVGKNINLTVESDYKSFYTISIDDKFLKSHRKILQKFKPWSFEKEVKEKIIAEYNGFDMSISIIGEKIFKNIIPKEKEKIIDNYKLSDEEKENLIDLDNSYIRKEVRKVWGNRVDDAYLIKSLDGDESFLQGDYIFRGFLKDNETPFSINFTIKAGDLNEISMILPYIPEIKDSDGDGIIDEDDACPKIAGLSNEDLEKNGCPEPELEELVDLTINNIWDGLGIELIKLEGDFDEIIVKASKVNGKVSFNKKDYKSLVNENKTSIKVLGVPFGLYILNTFAISNNPPFPGKHYLSLFSNSDTLDVDSFNKPLKFNIPNQNRTLGREIIIYFDPFSSNDEEEYKLYLGDSKIPSAVVAIAGELHIVGFSSKYNGDIKIIREDFKPALINIKKGKEKTYHVAYLNNPLKLKNDLKREKDINKKEVLNTISFKKRSFFTWCGSIFFVIKSSFEIFINKF